MTRRNWLKALAAALCGLKAAQVPAKVPAAKLPAPAPPGGTTRREGQWVKVDGCTITFHGVRCDYPAPPRVTTCVVTLPPGARVYTTEAP